MDSYKWIIIVLIIIVLIIGVVIMLVNYVHKKIQRVSRMFLGTSSIMSGLQQQKENLATTPKSVASMTRIYEPQIAKDFPDFNWMEFRNKAEVMLQNAFLAISTNDINKVKDCSDDIKQKIQMQIDKNKSDNVIEKYSDVTIHKTEITRYEKQAGKCIITLQSAVGHKYYKTKNGTVIAGDKTMLEQTKYNIELMYVQDASKIDTNTDKAMGVTCPSCGAPITTLGDCVCEYCGLAITAVNVKAWFLQDYYEVTYEKI